MPTDATGPHGVNRRQFLARTAAGLGAAAAVGAARPRRAAAASYPDWIPRSDKPGKRGGSMARPSVSPAYAAERGFTPAEIDAELRPWIKEARDGARQLVRDAETALKEAQAIRERVADETTLAPVGNVE